MKNIVLIFSLSILFVNLGFSQRGVCGVIDQSAILERLEQNKRALKNNPGLRNDEIMYVPLQFHIVTEDDGSGGIGEENILEQLCRLNEDYVPVNMHFYLKNEFNYIPYSLLYNDPGNTFSSLKMSANKVNNAINIFIVDNIVSSGEGQTLGYYQPTKDWIVVIKDRVNAGTQTLSHELGHFFSLAHPFNGWESCPYDANEHGNPLNITEVPCSGADIELVDGSNCESAADKICDTPPDYNFGLTDPENNCSLDYEVKDINGDVIDVLENNYMSYFFNCASYQFTSTQIALMQADYQSSGRNYIRSDYEPNTDIIGDQEIEIVTPAFNATTAYYDYVVLDWYNLPNVSKYLVKVTTGFFTKETTYYHVDDSKLILTNLPADEKNVTVVIWPYNEGNSCNATPSSTHKFKTSSIPVNVVDLQESGRFNLYPSPIKLNSDQMILWSSSDIQESHFDIIDLSGKVLTGKYIEIIKGNNVLDLRAGLIDQAGMYIFKLSTPEKSYTKKIVFSK